MAERSEEESKVEVEVEMLKNKTLSKFTAKTKEIHQQMVGPFSGSALFTKTTPQNEHELHTKPVHEEPFTGTSKAEKW